VTALDADVLVVGYGPVGQVLSVLLAARGHRVLVLERWEHPYDLPRATSVDGETARILAAAGIGEAFTRYGAPADAYEWRNADDKTLLRIEFAGRGRYGWPDATTVHQPDLEAALIARGEELSTLTVLRGHEVTAVADLGDRVEVTAGRTFTASWAIGCDGANSVVRERMGVPFSDLGFSFDWLLCDVTLREPRTFDPANTQFCDPARPRTQVASGPGHRRWEFMRLPGETVEELEHPGTAWRLLADFDVTPGNADLLRHHVYRFRAGWAEQWRAGRLLVAGDAAHLMPPFAGQGLCSGVRDVLNLAWKLDLVLRGVCAGTLLDTYTAERLPHVRESIDASVALGKVICVTDPEEAARRDASMLANADAVHRPHGPALPLRHGLLHRRLGAFAAAPAGEVIPQGTVVRGAERGLFDDVIGTGFVVLTTDDPAEVFGQAELDVLAALGAHLVRVGEGFVEDVDGVYRPHLARCLIVRPDYHVFGAARTSGEAAKLVAALAAGLGMTGGVP
jgi:flavoprotein hydroxylase